ncbi:MAG: hypothetical protein RR635_07130, partial [Oscillospiraceae bacterium]
MIAKRMEMHKLRIVGYCKCFLLVPWALQLPKAVNKTKSSALVGVGILQFRQMLKAQSLLWIYLV